MLAGYRNLEWLKARLLPAGMGDDGDFDADLADIGKGVAALFDRFTGRTLRRTVDATFSCSADAESVTVTCYPIESVKSVHLIDAFADTDITGAIASINNPAGMIYFIGQTGTCRQTLLVTSTGGYWCDDQVESMPEDATAMPDDLVSAWVQQCRAVCEAENIFRQKGAANPDRKNSAPTPATHALAPGVRSILNLYMRCP